MAAVFTERERSTLVAIAEATLPPGRMFPGAGASTVTRVEGFLNELPGPARTAYRGLVHLFDGLSYAHRRRGLASLDAGDLVGLLERWRDADIVRRNAVKALMVPLKVAHFDDPSFFQKVGCVYTYSQKAEVKPPWFRERVHDANKLGGDVAVEVDVVVIGTGAGGAVVARELAEHGVAVAMLEEGNYVDRSEFTGRPLDMQKKLYRASGATFTIGNVPITIPLGMTVGGSTTVNSGTCYRVPDRILEEWVKDFGLRELTPDGMAPYFDRVEHVLRVAPVTPETLGGSARVIARGADALGLKKHLPLKRNAPDCDGQGVCCFGCPTDAKRSTNVSYVPMALKAGAELFTGVRAQRVIVEGGRAVGVVARARGGRTVTVRARAVIVACGTLLTPAFLMRNGLGDQSGQLGRNLSIHPATGIIAVMRERIESWKGVPQGYAIEDFHEEGLMFEGAALPLDFSVGLMPQIGPELVELAEGFDRIAQFGLMVEDTSRGRVRLVGDQPVVTYNLNDSDLGRMKRGIDILARVFLAGGAERVLLPAHGFNEVRTEADLARFRDTRIRPRDLDVSAYHPLGTARMGTDPRSSVVDAEHQVHDTPGLYVVDGAAVPSSLGVNPQVTIMALATRAADKLASRLS
jgi:choline dehydrogenase-like flavoprotein